MASTNEETIRALAPLIEIGIHHEQQHQELMVTDLKHVLSVNPLRPAYREDLPLPPQTEARALDWVNFEGGLYDIGYDGAGFCYDNETPRHKEYLEPFQLGSRLVTNGEYLQFMADGGYERPELWLSAGWATVQEKDWSEPFYWEQHKGRWYAYTLGGLREVHPAEPVCHLSYFEAEAFARWADARLPTEAEWEVAARDLPVQGNFVDKGDFHPTPLAPDAVGHTPDAGDGPMYQMFGDVWEWTRSHYSPYPGYDPLPGAIGEYNGKFMCGQFVLRGGSCATSQSHIRPTYRTFFHPDEAWQFMGLRLARDGK
jgi:ergothioneine biosynthesis protein EgtB